MPHIDGEEYLTGNGIDRIVLEFDSAHSDQGIFLLKHGFTESGLIFFTFLGGACSETNFFSSSFIFSNIFFALGANGILVSSVICINSTDIMGGRSIGFFAKNGKLTAVIKTRIVCKTEEIKTLLVMYIIFLYRAQI